MVGATQPCPFVIKSENKKMEVMNDIKKTPVDCSGVNSYVGQWNKYFDVEGNLAEHLKSITYNQSLRGCHFRSVCWRVFLNCLPHNTNEWTEALSKSRNEYDIIKEKHKMLPNNETQNVDVENPLSQSDQSVWKQYFQDQDLRNIIERDVKRTLNFMQMLPNAWCGVFAPPLPQSLRLWFARFPEMDYFSKEDVRRTMETILFCYAREHIKLSYRQGMHELLAPILFVLHCDLQGAFHAQDIGELPKIIQTLFQGKYVENDAYTMFCHLMAATNSWYSVNEVEVDETPEGTSNNDPIPTVPFQPSEDNHSPPPLEITNKLNRIHNELLQHYDRELYCHISRLEIIPQVYGLRWVRLLFGREFDLQDLLVLWDAMFADSAALDLVDYIFVAMMVHIRDHLLTADYCTCMRLLMKYPAIEDIFTIVNLAIYYRDPQNNRRPSFNRFKPHPPPTSQSQSKEPVKKSKSTNGIFSNIKFENLLSNLGNDFKRAVSTTPKQTKKPVYKEFSTPMDRPRSRTSSVEQASAVQEQDSLFELHNNLQLKCQFCADKIDANIRLLQHHLVDTHTDDTEPEAAVNGDCDVTKLTKKNEEIFLALASLKQVRDVLRGSLNLDQSATSKQAANMEIMNSKLDDLPLPPVEIPTDSSEPLSSDVKRQLSFKRTDS